MKKIALILIVLGIFAIAVSANFAQGTLNNTTDFQKAIDDAQKQNKTIMLVFDQKGCYYCDLFKEDVLSNSEVISELNEDYITVIIDVNQQPQLASKYKVYGTPTIVFIDANENQIDRIEGYVDADEFLDIFKGL